MTEIYKRDPLVLELSIVAHMAIELPISTTYEMEGDRFEVLLVYSRIKALRGLGSRIKSRARGVLVNVENAIARTQTTPKVGMVFTKYFDGHGDYIKVELLVLKKAMGSKFISCSTRTTTRRKSMKIKGNCS